MINGFWSNEGMNDDKGTRQEAIEDLETHFQTATESILHGTKPEEEEDIDKDNPFFAAMDTRLPKLEAPTSHRSVEDVIAQQQEFLRYTDQ